VLAQVAGMVEAGVLHIDAGGFDLGEGGLRQDLLGDVVDRAVHDFVDEADVLVYAGRDAGDDLAAGDFRVDDRLAAAPA
jgi:hypothetical protein